MNRWLEAPLLAIFPRRCAYCGKPVASDKASCRACASELPRITGETCRLCGREKKFCTCSGEKYFSSLSAPFYYSGRARNGVWLFKFKRNARSAKALGDELAQTINERLSDIKFDFVLSVPMTEKHMKERGYDQCALLATEISERTGIPYKQGLIKKIFDTEKQHGLNFYFRKGNLTGVFDIVNPDDVKGKTVLLCDDISTSGETLNECAKMLWLCGAKEVHCIVVAVTQYSKKKKYN